MTTPKPRAPAKVPAKPPAKATAKPADKPRPPKASFPKKARPPSDAELAARLPAAIGRRFEAVRAFLTKQGAREDLHYYGPRTGWAYRYLDAANRSLCSLVVMDTGPVLIVGLDAATQAAIRWEELSDVARRARRMAHGTPSLLWLDLPVDGTALGDLKTMLKAKLASGRARDA